MKIILSLFLAATLCSFSTSQASTSNTNTLPSNTQNPDGKLIKSYVLDDKIECSYIYNDNNTLKKIVFKVDGKVDFTESYTYENGKIVGSFKKKADGSSMTNKQYEYKNNLIVKEIININGELFETRYFKYNKDNFLEKITIKKNDGWKEHTTTTSIEKLSENKIKVKTTNVYPRIVTFDNKLRPQAAIPGYLPIVRINHDGITGNILVLNTYSGKKVSTNVESDHKFDNNGNLLSTKITYKYKGEVNTQKFKYNY